MKRLIMLPIAIALLAQTAVWPAHADTVVLHATLTAAKEVPPKASQGTGDATVTLDTATRSIVYTVTFTGLTGPATMAHFHGPAVAGANAGVQVPLGTNPTSPIKGTIVLTESQVADLLAGTWYVNVHTTANPGGEIRGQVSH